MLCCLHRHSKPAEVMPLSRWILLVVLSLSSAAQAADHALVVLGAAVQQDGRPGAALQRRLDLALALAQRDPEAIVIVTGGAVASEHAEAPTMAQWLTDRGIPRSRIVVESAARHTGENADFTVPLLKAAGVKRATVVTDQSHLLRGLFHTRAALRTVGLGDVVVDGAGADEGLGGLDRLTSNVQERVRLLRDAYFRLRDGTLGLAGARAPLPDRARATAPRR
jgi:vancomycin permeability regulator SanA